MLGGKTKLNLMRQYNKSNLAFHGITITIIMTFLHLVAVSKTLYVAKLCP